MLKDLFLVIHHYDKQLFLDMKKIKDPRCQSYITYPLEVMLVVRILAYCCHIESMAELNDDFNHENVIKNVSRICGIELENMPHGDTINNLFERMDIQGLRDLLTSIIKRMINSRFFEMYRYDKEYYQLIIDGTQLYSFHKKHIEKCLVRNHSDGTKTYHTQSLTAYIIIGEGLMLPIDFEMIENEQEDTPKQDCEINAAKRLLKRIKKTYPRLKLILSADALYACEPIIEICEAYHWKYVIRLKEGRIGSLMQEFSELKAGKYTETESAKVYKNKKIIIEKSYEYVNDLEYENHKINIAEIKEEKKDNHVSFTYMTDIKITKKNINEIAEIGRKRWKIENKGFNDEKNHGYGLTHAYSYHANAIQCHYILLLISHLFMQLLEHYLKTKALTEKIKTIGKAIKEALRLAHLNAKDYVEILSPRQIRQEVSY